MDSPKRAACVIGWPAKHSRSPKLHGYWIKKYGLAGDYRAEDVKPEEFSDFLGNLAAKGYVGANITMPHKEAAMALTEPDERARKVGVCNTVWLRDGKLKSTNTDVEGFIGALDQCAPGWDKRTRIAVVLGAGGASRAVVFGLIERGIKTIHVVNRTFAKAEEFVSRFGPAVKPAHWTNIPQLLSEAQLLVNSTPLGMKGQPSLAIDLTPMKPGSVVSDIIYVPLKTDLLKAAEARGFPTSNGLDMLLHQAVRGFTEWFGVKPEVTKEQRDLLVADLVG